MSDPFWAALQPPPNESPADRDRRLFAEFEAKRISDGIDEMLGQERKERRMKQEIKILLLGQSESGKSTTLKREYLPCLVLGTSAVPPLFTLSLVSILSSPSISFRTHLRVCAESGERRGCTNGYLWARNASFYQIGDIVIIFLSSSHFISVFPTRKRRS